VPDDDDDDDDDEDDSADHSHSVASPLSDAGSPLSARSTGAAAIVLERIRQEAAALQRMADPSYFVVAHAMERVKTPRLRFSAAQLRRPDTAGLPPLK
jgi:hypothetical protein